MRITVGWMQENTMASVLPFSYVVGEVRELWVEILALNGQGIREEWSDVACCSALWLHGAGVLPGWWPIPEVFGGYSARKFTKRREMWKHIFAYHEVGFKKEYLINGGNYAKLAKVRKALALANVSIVDEEWLKDSGICTE